MSLYFGKSARHLLFASRAIQNQTLRSTWVYTRVHPPLLGSNEESPLAVGPYILEKHYDELHLVPRVRIDDLYATEEQTDERKPPDVEIILLESVAGVGFQGEIIKLESRITRKLILKKQAAYASPFNREYYKEMIENSRINDKRPSSKLSLMTLLGLEKVFVLIKMNDQTPWTIEKKHIRIAFRKVNIYIEDDAITLPEKSINGPNKSLDGKDFFITLTINKNKRELVNVRCVLYHKDSEIHPQWQRLSPRIAVIPEQQETLDKMFMFEPFFEEVKQEFFH